MSTLGNRPGSGGRMGGAIDADRIFQRHTVSDIRQVGGFVIIYGIFVRFLAIRVEKLGGFG